MKPIFIAHRGYASAYPENTLIALDAAREAGAQFVEVDIQLSSDHIPVLFHDRDLQRLCQQKGAIHDYSFSQLEKFKVSNIEKFANKYSENKITSLYDFIIFLKKHPEINAFIELKRLMIDRFGKEKVLDVLLPLFDGMEQQISFISYNIEILKIIHNQRKYATGIVVDGWAEYDSGADWQPDWVFCSAEGLPANNAALQIKPKIAVFEVGNLGLAKHLLAKGIRYLETFRIKEMREAFKEN